MQSAWADLNYALRRSATRPGFAAAVVFTLSVGIGSSTALFSLVNAVLLRPFPYEEPDRIVRVVSVATKQQTSRPNSLPDLEDWRTQNATFVDLAACWPMRTTLVGREAAQSVIVTLTTPELFRVFGTKPILGRTFLPEEDRPGGDVQRAVLSFEFWKTKLGGDPNVLGRAVMLQGTSYTVIGIMPQQFRYPGRTDLWVPIATFRADDRLKSRGGRYVLVIGRLKAGVSVSQAQADLDTISARLAKEYPNTDKDIRPHLITLRGDEAGDIRPYLLLLLGVVGIVLLICCGNVANLLLTRAVSRRREIAIRLALGAQRSRLIQQMLLEAVVLSVLGGILGLVLAYWAVRALPNLVPVPLPVWIRIDMDWVVLAFSILLSLATSLLFGLAPALQSSRAELTDYLHESARSSPGSASSRFRNGIVVAEVALAAVLLNGAGLLERTFFNLQSTDPGFSTERLVIANVVPDRPTPSRDAVTAYTSYFRRVMEVLRVLPGVVAVGGSNTLPYTRDAELRAELRFTVKGLAGQEEGRALQASLVSDVSPDYFRAIGIPILKGRSFGESDTVNSPPVVIVNQRTAELLWPGLEPVGQQLKSSKWATVVGVAGDVKYRATEHGDGIELYFPYTVYPPGHFYFIVQTGAEPRNMLGAVTKAISDVDKNTAITYVKTMDQIKEELLWQQRLWGLMFTVFAAIATALAGVGIFAVMSFATKERTREIGIKIALGAEQRQVIAFVLADGLKLTVLGLVLGGVAAFSLARFLSSLLFGVRPEEAVTLAAVSVILVSVALLACYLPARRAASTDPAVALRNE